MNKRFINLAVALVLGIIAIFFINTHLQKQEGVISQLVQQGKLAEVVMSNRDIPKGTVIQKNMVDIAKVSSADLTPGYLKSFDSVIGKVAIVDILKDQYIYASMIQLTQQEQTLSQNTPRGKRAYTIEIDKISAVGGMIKANDKVDIIGILPQGGGPDKNVILTLLEDIKVLSLGTQGEKETITIAVSSEEIKILLWALEAGRIKFVLRSPLDTAQEGTLKPFTYEQFVQKVQRASGMIEQPRSSQTQQQQEKKQPKPVEIYKGGGNNK